MNIFREDKTRLFLGSVYNSTQFGKIYNWKIKIVKIREKKYYKYTSSINLKKNIDKQWTCYL